MAARMLDASEVARVAEYLATCGCATVRQVALGVPLEPARVRRALKVLGAHGRAMGGWPNVTPAGERCKERGPGKVTEYRLAPWLTVGLGEVGR